MLWDEKHSSRLRKLNVDFCSTCLRPSVSKMNWASRGLNFSLIENQTREPEVNFSLPEGWVPPITTEISRNCPCTLLFDVTEEYGEWWQIQWQSDPECGKLSISNKILYLACCVPQFTISTIRRGMICSSKTVKLNSLIISKVCRYCCEKPMSRICIPCCKWDTEASTQLWESRIPESYMLTFWSILGAVLHSHACIPVSPSAHIWYSA